MSVDCATSDLEKIPGRIKLLLTCPMCLKLFKDPALISSCQHVFCYDCINEGIESGCVPCSLPYDEERAVSFAPTSQSKRKRKVKFECPVCRQPAFKWMLQRVPPIASFLDRVRSTVEAVMPSVNVSRSDDILHDGSVESTVRCEESSERPVVVVDESLPLFEESLTSVGLMGCPESSLPHTSSCRPTTSQGTSSLQAAWDHLDESLVPFMRTPPPRERAQEVLAQPVIQPMADERGTSSVRILPEFLPSSSFLEETLESTHSHKTMESFVAATRSSLLSAQTSELKSASVNRSMASIDNVDGCRIPPLAMTSGEKGTLTTMSGGISKPPDDSPIRFVPIHCTRILVDESIWGSPHAAKYWSVIQRAASSLGATILNPPLPQALLLGDRSEVLLRSIQCVRPTHIVCLLLEDGKVERYSAAICEGLLANESADRNMLASPHLRSGASVDIVGMEWLVASLDSGGWLAPVATPFLCKGCRSGGPQPSIYFQAPRHEDTGNQLSDHVAAPTGQPMFALRPSPVHAQLAVAVIIESGEDNFDAIAAVCRLLVAVGVTSIHCAYYGDDGSAPEIGVIFQPTPDVVSRQLFEAGDEASLGAEPTVVMVLRGAEKDRFLTSEDALVAAVTTDCNRGKKRVSIVRRSVPWLLRLMTSSAALRNDTIRLLLDGSLLEFEAQRSREQTRQGGARSALLYS